jgi:hypothetical protein
VREALDLALASASAHGAESDPEHETGDLLELIEALFRNMTPEQQRTALLEYGDGRAWWGDDAERRAAALLRRLAPPAPRVPTPRGRKCRGCGRLLETCRIMPCLGRSVRRWR